MAVRELSTKYNTCDKSCYILINTSAQKLGDDICNTILKIHVLTGCDATSKVETKSAALKATIHLLASFGKNREPIFLALEQAEKYLFSVLYSKRNCNNFNNLW